MTEVLKGKYALISVVLVAFLLLLGTLTYLIFPSGFLRNYIPDFLWAMAFCLCLLVIAGMSIRWSYVIFLFCLCVFTGIAFELMQYKELIKGTGDIIDVVVYAAGAACGILLVKGRINR